MKNILFFIVWFCCPVFVFGQSVVATTLHDYNAIVQSVTINNDGNYLISSTENLLSNNSFASVHDNDGALVWREKVCDCPRPIVGSFQAHDGKIIHLIQDGKVYQTDAEGKGALLLYDIAATEPFVSFFYRVVKHEGKAYVFGSKALGETAQSVMVTFDLNDVSNFHYSCSSEEHSIRGIWFTETDAHFLLFSNGSLRKMNTNNEVLWQKEISLNGNRSVDIRDIVISEDGDVYASGSVINESSEQNFNAVIMSLDSEGEVIWSKEFPHRTLCDVEDIMCFYGLNHIAITESGNIITVGAFGFSGERLIYPTSNVSIIETDIVGNVLWTAEDLLPLSINQTIALFSAESNNFSVIGTTGISDAPGSERVFFIELDTYTSTTEIEALDGVALYPNPTRDYVHLEVPALGEDYTVTLFDSTGKQVYQGKQVDQIYVGELAQGLYTLSVYTAKGQKTFQWMKVR